MAMGAGGALQLQQQFYQNDFEYFKKMPKKTQMHIVKLFRKIL